MPNAGLSAFLLLGCALLLGVGWAQIIPNVFDASNQARPEDAVSMNQQMAQNERFYDRRIADGWWNLYPFGELFYDMELERRPNEDRQIDLNFYFPFYGFRFNYTFMLPNGLIAFSWPEWVQPPYTFPEPKWPETRDPSFIAPFYASSQFQYVGETGISHVWHRTVHRARQDMYESGYSGPGNPQQPPPAPVFGPNIFDPSQPGYQERMRQYGNQRRQAGYIEDDFLLNNITKDIQEGIIGANGFRALHALIVTWERMAYGGAPKVVHVNLYNEVKRWQNTYQLVLATDEIRSYVMFNYGTLNWTASNEAGALRGRGGMQAAIAGFNGGNGTGFTPLPYSGEGEMFKLARFSSMDVPGRWIYRVDEQILPGGCSNESIGDMQVAPDSGTMLGGLTVNVSGPCIRPGDQVVILFDEFIVDCETLSMGRARCVLPKFHKIGLINTKFSRDGGMSYPYVGTFYVVAPDRSDPNVMLVKDVLNTGNTFNNPYAESLEIRWSAVNLTADINKRVNIELWGFWEDTERSEFERVAILSQNEVNSGVYSFDPRMLVRQDRNEYQYWRYMSFGSIRVAVDDDVSPGVLYSHLTPFAWYFLPEWHYQYGNNWALDKCIEWFNYDGRRRNIYMDLMACPCTLDQAVLDMGRYMPVLTCDMTGDSGCPYHRGAQHCIQSVQASWTGAQQVCCYDFEGWLMFSDDYENADRLKYYSPGVPYRAHIFGSYPYKIPPYIPSLSNYMNDLMPYEMCCKYAQHCEFYFWRRQTNGCQEYKPPAAGFAYGEPHFITYDRARYTFNGKGYYVLAMSDHPWNKLMVQIRLEQPPATLWGTFPNATVITGVAVQENDSDVVQVLARKEFRRWRYRTDVLVRGIPAYFDSSDQKYQQFKGVSIYSPARNMNQSEIIIQLRSGAGVRVSEAYGILDVMVLLPPSYNMTWKRRPFFQNFDDLSQEDRELMENQQFTGRMDEYYNTYGLLGVYNGDARDDFTTPDGISSTAVSPNLIMSTEGHTRAIHDQFGPKWRVDGSSIFIGPVLFQDRVRPIYNPLSFSTDIRFWYPKMDTRVPLNATLIFTAREVQDICQGNWACKFDYAATGVREIALNTLSVEQKFLGMQQAGSRRLISCGALWKAHDSVKTPPGNNYLDGVTVTFSCRPDYFPHGDQQRTCINGTWSPGWHVWCRTRAWEIGLKWLTGLLTSMGIVLVIMLIFIGCYFANVRPKLRERKYRARGRPPPPPRVAAFWRKEPQSVNTAHRANATAMNSLDQGYKSPTVTPSPRPPTYDDRIPVLEQEPKSAGVSNGNGRSTPTVITGAPNSNRFIGQTTSA